MKTRPKTTADAEAPAVEGADWALPSFRTVEFRPRSSDFCVAVFVIDEGARLLSQLEAMQRVTGMPDVIVADGGSTDGSTEPAGLESRGVNTLLVKEGPGRLGAQMRMAFAWALRRGYAGVVTIDGNGKDDPEGVPRLLERLEEGFDHAQGSRFVPGGRSQNLPPLRHLAVRLIHAPAIRLAAGFPYTDTTNGFRAYSARFLADPRVALFRDVFAGYELHYYLAIRAARLGFRVTEVPVTRRYPPAGRVPTKISPLKGNLGVLRALWKACTGKFDPPGEGDA